jgi:hypothetical protein
VRARVDAARAVVATLVGRDPRTPVYPGSRLELGVLGGIGAVALLSITSAFAVSGSHIVLSTVAVLACGSFGAAGMASLQTRNRIALERASACDLVDAHRMAKEQSESLDLELGWLKALAAALRARAAFDGHKGEGGQLADLAKWRPDLTAVVEDVAKSSIVPPTAG